VRAWFSASHNHVRVRGDVSEFAGACASCIRGCGVQGMGVSHSSVRGRDDASALAGVCASCIGYLVGSGPRVWRHCSLPRTTPSGSVETCRNSRACARPLVQDTRFWVQGSGCGCAAQLRQGKGPRVGTRGRVRILHQRVQGLGYGCVAQLRQGKASIIACCIRGFGV